MPPAATRRAKCLPLFEFDRGICGAAEIAGADEAGRGSLAGPLVVAAVVFDYSRFEPARLAKALDGLTDSKKLNAEARTRLYPRVIRFASRFSVIVCGNTGIDERGLHKTNLFALGRGIA
ncbi:MAG: ribonuclease HII, partial [Pseudomonadota bacterium]